MAPLAIRFKPRARTHIQEAAAFYALEGNGSLVARFLDAVDDALERIAKFPESGPIFHRETRRLRVNRFPYSIYYRFQSDAIVVFAVLHGKRNPALLSRLSE